MNALLHIAERVLNRPLLIHPDKAPLVIGILEGRYPIDAATWREDAQARIDDMPETARTVMRGPAPSASRFHGSSMDVDPLTGKQTALPYRRHNGVAIISIIGTTINRGAFVGSYSGEVSYEGIQHQIATAADDPRSRAILLDIQSPGGEAIGAFETAAIVRAAREKKPVVAVVNGMAASAAYAIASGATRIVTTATGVAGSIGVVLMHADYSRALDKKGITPTLIFAGDHKVDGNPFEPLSTGVREDLQREVDHFYSLFVETVAAGRVGLTTDAIRGTQARTYIGAEAIDVGLVDSVGTFASVLNDLSTGQLGPSFNDQSRGFTMSTANNNPAANVITQEAHNAAITAAVAAANQQASALAIEAAEKTRTAALAEGITLEAARQAGIDKLAASMTGHDKLVADMKADPKVTVEQAGMRLIEAEGAQRAGRLAAVSSGIETVVGDKAPSTASATDRLSAQDPAKKVAAMSATQIAAQAREHIATQAAKGINVSAAAAVEHVTSQIAKPAV